MASAASGGGAGSAPTPADDFSALRAQVDAMTRWEVVSSPNTAAAADVLRAALTWTRTTFTDTHLTDGAELGAFAKSLQHGPYLPVVYDSLGSLELNQPVSALRYMASLGAAPLLANPNDALRADFAAEAVFRFLRDDKALAGNAAAARAAVADHLKSLWHLLTCKSALAEATEPSITHGDLAVWVYCDEALKAYGEGIFAAAPVLLKLHEKLSANPRLAGFVRLPSTQGAKPAAPVPAPAPKAPAPKAVKGPVLVTGAAGYIGSYIVKMLLARGYVVHATTRSLANEKKYEHLLRMGAEAQEMDTGVGPVPATLEATTRPASRLKLFEADVLAAGAYDAAMAGCSAVIHAASPFFFTPKVSAEDELLRPAVEGTRGLVRSALACPSVRTLVVTSSAAAVYMKPVAPDHFFDESDWSDLAWLQETKQYYAQSKLLAEREAWRVLREEGPALRPAGAPPLRMATMNPSLCIGPLLQAEMNTSCAALLELMDGSKAVIPNRAKSFVDVRDVALAHVLAVENPSAQGRYFLVGGDLPWSTVVALLKRAVPGAAYPPTKEEGPPPPPQALATSARAKELGVTLTSIEVSIRDCALSLVAKGFLDKTLGITRD